MPNNALLSSGQQGATAVAAPLPQTVPASPANLGGVRGEGVQVILSNLKASTASFFYGGPGVTPTTGKEIVAGATEPPIFVNDTSEIFIVAVGAGTATASWSVTNR